MIHCVYMILHKETGEAWKTPNGKMFWREKRHASNAWTCHNEYYCRARRITITNKIADSEYHVVKCEVVPV